MARPRSRERQEIDAKCALVGRAVGPKSPPCLPIRSQAFVVRHGILNDESFDPFRMRQDHAETHRAAVILHVQRVARESERFGKVVHDLGEVIERVREFLRVGPVAMSKARVIGRDQVIVIGKAGEERLEHSR